MIDTARHRLADLLAEAAKAGTFSAARTAPVRDLLLEVRGVGPISFPVTQAQARELSLLGRPARYGRRERTLLDRGVRDTWEIPKSRVKLDKRRFDLTLLPVLGRLGQDLGLPAGSTLKAELHSMLVYGPGQFFVQHQDTEKADAMVGSLVVGLPSTFRGGALEVRHHGETAAYRGSKKALSLVAFYSDCRHEVKPVRSGHRIVLTYHLMLDSQRATAAVPDPELVGSLAQRLDEHFGAPGAPSRLVYLLDHEYTPRGLDWARLKGTDAQRAQLLRAAAGVAGCETVLALADIHQTWSAYEPEYRRRSWYAPSRYDRWDDWDDEEEDDDPGEDGDDDYDLQELIESEVTIDTWVDGAGERLAKLGLSLGDDEVCATTDSDDLDPYRSEYEGYMGNWGNTLDRWYHRGAIMLWPRARSFAVRAEASPPWALDTLDTLVRNRDVTGAQEAAATLAPFWGRIASQVEGRTLFTKSLRTARRVDDPALAAMLLGPFRLEMLTKSHAKALSDLLDRYGEPWVATLVATWSPQDRFHHQGRGMAEWIASLPGLCLALQGAGDAGTAVARLLVQASWRWLGKVVEQDLAQSAPSRRQRSLSELERPLAAMLEAAALVGATDVRDQAVALLCRGEPDLIGLAIGVLRATAAARRPSLDLESLTAHCAAALGARLARPSRAGDDWSIELPKGCSCGLCEELRSFLSNRSRRTFEWPLAQDRRAHVHRRLEAAELPVTHQTRRHGRPYTLVLAKTDELFERERQARRHDEADLAWLRQQRATRPRRRAGLA